MLLVASYSLSSLSLSLCLYVFLLWQPEGGEGMWGTSLSLQSSGFVELGTLDSHYGLILTLLLSGWGFANSSITRALGS